jgi:hypothetical protein
MAYRKITRAILARASMTAHYADYIRFFSPHVLGKDHQGRLTVLVFQYAGGMQGGLRVSGQWLCFRIAAISALQRNSDNWHPGDRGVRPSCVVTVDLSA